MPTSAKGQGIQTDAYTIMSMSQKTYG